MKDWRSLGTTHRLRDEVAASLAQGRVELDTARAATSHVRWPAIVRAVQAMVAAYNEGIGRELLVVTETTDGQHPSLMLEASGRTIPALVVTLDGTELNVGSRSTDPGGGGITIKRWVDLSRTDDETAAYVLQEWMDRL